MSQADRCSRNYWADVADDRLWPERELPRCPPRPPLSGDKRTHCAHCEFVESDPSETLAVHSTQPRLKLHTAEIAELR